MTRALHDRPLTASLVADLPIGSGIGMPSMKLAVVRRLAVMSTGVLVLVSILPNMGVSL